MFFRHRHSKKVAEVTGDEAKDFAKDPMWDRIDHGQTDPGPQMPPGVQQTPPLEPRTDLVDLGKPELLAVADREQIHVNRRLGADRLRAEIIAAAPVAPAPERDLAPGT
jgi:hypothetical protein